jgi:hypothetical protein
MKDSSDEGLYVSHRAMKTRVMKDSSDEGLDEGLYFSSSNERLYVSSEQTRIHACFTSEIEVTYQDLLSVEAIDEVEYRLCAQSPLHA